MRLKELKIRNFRKIRELTLVFPKGLCVIVGENNAGKTAVIDALRLMLFSSRDFDALRLNEDDFCSGEDFPPIELSCNFCELNEEDEVHFQESLIDLGDGTFDMRMNARIEFNKTSRRTIVKLWGGELEGGHLPSNHYDRIAAVYLQPLRDPESGLRPGRHSQISRLIDSLATETQHSDFETIAKEANSKISVLDPVTKARGDINGQMAAITGIHLTQKTELVFTEPDFYRIIAGLQPEIDGLPFPLNGLGYNNLIFTSATLGTLRQSSQFSFKSILVEEPEAHLHPQLQVLFLRHLSKVTDGTQGNDVQVIASSHSPILASQAPLDSMVSLHHHQENMRAVSICNITMDATLKKKLQRFLDATRAELFFARRILMVEGIAEALLLPVIVKICSGSLKESAVTLINSDGLNFNAFLPLFGTDGIPIPVAILTDGDAESVGKPISATATGLKAKEAEYPHLRVEYCQRTFEHELARSPTLLPHILDAYSSLHPELGAQLKVQIQNVPTADKKADTFLTEFLRSKTSKGEFAQELAVKLDVATLTRACVPTYIIRVLEYLNVIPSEIKHEQSGNPSSTNSGAKAK